jgi:hypothetical protein
MIRILIVVAAIALVVGGVGAALSGAENRDPGPAIVLDKDPSDDARTVHDRKAFEAASGGHIATESDRAQPSDDRSAHGDPFTAVQPQPVIADEPDEPDDADEPDDEESDDEESNED